MTNRIELHDILKNILGSSNVYYQPPESIKINYPCIIYHMEGLSTNKADDILYKTKRQYSITHIHTNPDIDLVNDILKLQYASFDRRYVSDNLYHDVYTIYY